MMTGAIPINGGMKSGPITQRLSVSFGVSVCVHAAAIAVLVGMLESMPIPLSRSGGTPTIQVALVGQPSIRFSPPPEEPPMAAALPIAPRAVEPPPPPMQWRPATPPPIDQPQSTAPPGLSVQSEASTVDVPAGAVLPPGSTSVGALKNTDRLGRTQAMRLEQRFPKSATNPAQLREPLLVPYPPRAAWNHREARIVALLILDAGGRIIETNLYPDDPLFAQTVMDVLSRARFAPAQMDGKPEPYWTILEFVFTLRRSVVPPVEPRPPGSVQPSVGKWNPGAALPSSGQRVVTAFARV
jgi:Gram-negative bacterial TonB protein C-terminal